jgi:hypothetical protein
VKCPTVFGFLSCPPWHSSLFQGKGKGAALRFGSKSWVGPCWTRGCEVLTQSPHSLDLTQWLSRLMCFWRYLEDMEIRTWAMDGHGTDPGWLMIMGGHTTLIICRNNKVRGTMINWTWPLHMFIDIMHIYTHI